ncbi:unnamed protein product [Rotaria magnacalcarata]|uniref:Cation/H+ exchanger transmembrane domain-containing protein n=1 Tax=Rotaria magnacalcarata TaxID=392030 RepID=A0A819P7I3_9BILA|nr:unnamed protein product [Rotaria magnacalcarata]CAF4009047.1 unnamed protein product [Rotaria magnacalcarata]
MQIFIILLLVRIMGWLLALIKQPPVIGEIIVGVIIGHSVLGNSLELEQKQLKRRWEDSLPISIATIIVPYGAGAALSIYFGMRTSLGSLNDPLHGGITVLIFAVATLIKFLPATLMTKCVTHRSWRFSTSVGILMNTRGLVELIALNIDLQLNILSPGLFTMFFL